MRWHILRTLVLKETHRHLANRGGLVLAVLLLGLAGLFAIFAPQPGTETTPEAGLGGVGGISRCLIDYAAEEDPWIVYLRAARAPELTQHIRFRRMADAPKDADGQLLYPPSTGAIQIRALTDGPDGQPRYKVWVWYPPGNRVAMSFYETWFWTHSRQFFREQAADQLRELISKSEPKWPELDTGPTNLLPWLESHWWFRREVERIAQPLGPAAQQAVRAAVPDLTVEYSPMKGDVLDVRSGLATGLVIFSLFFFCVYLLPSLTCEERERGILLAQALSPASPLEIVAAKFCFYPVLGIGFAALLAGILSPRSLVNGFFWATLATLAVGSLGIGMTISCLARTQRAASMGALGYLLAVSMAIMVCDLTSIRGPQFVFLEFHGPRMMHAALADKVVWPHYIHLAAAVLLAIAWATTATWLFRRRGWQ